MPSWDKVQGEIKKAGSVHDVIRRQHLRRLSDLTGRNTIVYYSGWMEKEFLIKQGLTGHEVNDSDKNGFMSTIHELDRSKGLDLCSTLPVGMWPQRSPWSTTCARCSVTMSVPSSRRSP